MSGCRRAGAFLDWILQRICFDGQLICLCLILWLLSRGLLNFLFGRVEIAKRLRNDIAVTRLRDNTIVCHWEIWRPRILSAPLFFENGFRNFKSPKRPPSFCLRSWFVVLFIFLAMSIFLVVLLLILNHFLLLVCLWRSHYLRFIFVNRDHGFWDSERFMLVIICLALLILRCKASNIQVDHRWLCSKIFFMF